MNTLIENIVKQSEKILAESTQMVENSKKLLAKYEKICNSK